jgi:hypothetical protein
MAVPIVWTAAIGAAAASTTVPLHGRVVDASAKTRAVAVARDASSAYGNGHTTPTSPPASVGPASGDPTTSAHHSNGLPFTGGDVLGLTFIGIGMVLMGTAFIGAPRRRGPADLPAES